MSLQMSVGYQCGVSVTAKVFERCDLGKKVSQIYPG